jgi:hypothetical protein
MRAPQVGRSANASATDWSATGSRRTSCVPVSPRHGTAPACPAARRRTCRRRTASWGMVFRGEPSPDGTPTLLCLAFGRRDPGAPWQLSVYEVAHRRMHAPRAGLHPARRKGSLSADYRMPETSPGHTCTPDPTAPCRCAGCSTAPTTPAARAAATPRAALADRGRARRAAPRARRRVPAARATANLTGPHRRVEGSPRLLHARAADTQQPHPHGAHRPDHPHLVTKTAVDAGPAATQLRGTARPGVRRPASGPPVRTIADRLADLNEGGPKARRALPVVDGVHGLRDATRVSRLGCNLFAAAALVPAFYPAPWPRARRADRRPH